MKSSVFVLVVCALAITGFLIFSSLTSVSPRIHWIENYDEALQKSQATNKPLLLFFTGSDWCIWCNRLEKEVFEDPQFIASAGDSYIFLKLDFPSNKRQDNRIAKQNSQLQSKYHIEGYPTIILLDSNERLIGTTHYEAGGGKKYALYLKKLANSDTVY